MSEEQLNERFEEFKELLEDFLNIAENIISKLSDEHV